MLIRFNDTTYNINVISKDNIETLIEYVDTHDREYIFNEDLERFIRNYNEYQINN